MKIVTISFVVFLVLWATASSTYAQPQSSNFFEIQKQMEEKFKGEESTLKSESTGDKVEDSDYHRYKRWEWYWENRVHDDGSFPDLGLQNEYYRKVRASLKSSGNQNNPWTCINQTVCEGGYDGMGRTVAIAFHPTNANVFYVGAQRGGIWKTTDGGYSYTPIGDSLPFLGVLHILVDNLNPNTLYVALSDRGMYFPKGEGIYKSTDGGATWAPTGLKNNFSDNDIVYDLEMDRSNPSVIYASTNLGIFKTIDGGDNWTKLRNGKFNDLEIHPTNSNIIYGALNDYYGASQIFRSDDAGATWVQKTSFTAPATSFKISVTPAAPNKLVMLDVKEGLILSSSNKCETVTTMGSAPSTTIDMLVSPTDPNTILFGYVDPFVSRDGGATWTQISHWAGGKGLPEVHADQHRFEYNPVNNRFYLCNDGGIYSTDYYMQSFQEHSNGLLITMYYKVACSQLDPVKMVGGTQDNGGNKRNPDGTWTRTNGGDGMQVAIDYTDDNIFYTTYCNGVLYRTTDDWATRTTISKNIPGQPKGKWLTPYEIDHNNPNVLIAAYERIYRTTDRGDTWTPISDSLANGGKDKFTELKLAPSSSDVIYAGWNNILYVTTDMGANWVERSGPSNKTITSIEVDTEEYNTIWVTSAGLNDGDKVYKSTDGGISWTNISGDVPNIPVSTVVLDRTSTNHALYIATDIGIFYSDDSSLNWTLVGQGLPHSTCNDISIQYPTKKLRVGTWGRGVWEAKLIGSEDQSRNPPVVQITSPDSNDTFETNEEITITATATSAEGTIERVVFYNNGAKIAELEAPPYTVTVTGNVASTYAFQVQAIDEMGYIGQSETVKILIDDEYDLLTGDIIGTPVSSTWHMHTRGNVFDGKSQTFFEAADCSDCWVGVDLKDNYFLKRLCFHPRPGYEGRMTDGQFEASNDPDFATSTIIHQVTEEPTTEYHCMVLSTPESYRYVRYVGPSSGCCNIGEVQFFGEKDVPPVYNQLSGTIIGSPKSEYYKIFTKANVFDGDVTTFFEAEDRQGGWVGLDLGKQCNLQQICFHPRPNYSYRMTNGYFEASNDSTFQDATLLYTIAQNPPTEFNCFDINQSETFRYVRYVGPASSWCNVGEIQVYGEPAEPEKLTGLVIGSDESTRWPGYYKENVFDGNINTFFEANVEDNTWVGVDLQNTYKLTKLVFHPRTLCPWRMTGGYFEASNNADFSESTMLDSIAVAPPNEYVTIDLSIADGFRYVRYVSPPEGHCNISEIELYGYKVSGSLAAEPEPLASLSEVGSVGEIVDATSKAIAYPNPFENEIVLEGVSELAKLTLCDTNGKVVPFVLTQTATGAKLQLSPGYASGVYLLAIQEGNSVQLLKLVKR